MDTPNEDIDYIVCGDTPWVEGSQSLICALCGVEVFCSPTGQDLMAEHTLTPICVNCLDPRQDDEIVQPTPEQVDELKQYGMTEAEIAHAMWNLSLPREERL